MYNIQWQSRIQSSSLPNKIAPQPSHPSVAFEWPQWHLLFLEAAMCVAIPVSSALPLFGKGSAQLLEEDVSF